MEKSDWANVDWSTKTKRKGEKLPLEKQLIPLAHGEKLGKPIADTRPGKQSKRAGRPSKKDLRRAGRKSQEVISSAAKARKAIVALEPNADNFVVIPHAQLHPIPELLAGGAHVGYVQFEEVNVPEDAFSPITAALKCFISQRFGCQISCGGKCSRSYAC